MLKGPAISPLSLTICNGSASDTLRVRLLARPQAMHAPMMAIGPNRPDSVGWPDQGRTAAPATRQSMSSAMRRSKFSWKTNHAHQRCRHALQESDTRPNSGDVGALGPMTTPTDASASAGASRGRLSPDVGGAKTFARWRGKRRQPRGGRSILAAFSAFSSTGIAEETLPDSHCSMACMTATGALVSPGPGSSTAT